MRTPSIVALLVFAAALAGPPPAVSADPLSLKTHPVPSDRVAPPLAGARGPECGNATLIHKDGCLFCTACGYLGACG